MRASLLCLLLLASSLEGAEPEKIVYGTEFNQRLREATEAYEKGDYGEANRRLDAVDELQPGTAPAANLRAAIFVEEKKYAEADQIYDAILQQDPKFFPARFNKHEIRFLQKKYPEAREGFAALLEETPKNELLQYKIILCDLLAKNDEAARKGLDAMKFPSDTAAYYYAQAAWEFTHGNTKEGRAWLRSAQAVFSLDSMKLLAKSFEELGWIKKGERF